MRLIKVSLFYAYYTRNVGWAQSINVCCCSHAVLAHSVSFPQNPMQSRVLDVFSPSPEEYTVLIGSPIPYKKFGYDTLEAFIGSIPNAATIRK